MKRDSRACHRTSHSLPLYADGVLSPAESTSVESHLATCSDCRERLAADKRLATALTIGRTADVSALAPAVRRRVWERIERERRWLPVQRSAQRIGKAALAFAGVVCLALFVAAIVAVGRPIVEERAAGIRPTTTAAPRPTPSWPGPIAITVHNGGQEDRFDPGSPGFDALAASLQAVVSRTLPDAPAAIADPDAEAKRLKSERTAIEVAYLGSGVSAEIWMLIPLDEAPESRALTVLVGDGQRYSRAVAIEAGEELVGLRKVLGVREPSPSEPTDVPVVPAPTTADSRTVADDGAWEKVARSVTGVETILRPAIVPEGLGPVSVLKAEHSWFEVEYRGEVRRLFIGVGLVDPSTFGDEGERREIVVRGQPATLLVQNRAQPEEQVIVWWDEPGHWSLSPGDDSSRDRISYLVGAEGLGPEEVERVVASLRPEPREPRETLATPMPQRPTAGSPTATPRTSPPGGANLASTRITYDDGLVRGYYWAIDGERVDRTPRLSPDGRRLVYLPLDGKGNDLTRLVVRDFETGKDRDFTPEPGFSYTGAKWSPDGQSLAFVKYRSDPRVATPTEVWRLDLVGGLNGGTRLLYSVPGGAPDMSGPALGIRGWSADGRFVEVAGTIWGGGAPKLVRSDGSGAEDIPTIGWERLGVAEDSLIGDAVFSPARDFALFVVKTRGRMELSSIPAEGDRSLLLYDPATGRRSALAAVQATIYLNPSAISPDGAWVSFSTVVFPPSGPPKEPAKLWVVSRDGGGPREVADERGQPVNAEVVVWLSGGRALVQTASSDQANGERARLLIVDAASGAARELGSFERPWSLVSASRDGRRAVVVRGGWEQGEVRMLEIAP